MIGLLESLYRHPDHLFVKETLIGVATTFASVSDHHLVEEKVPQAHHVVNEIENLRLPRVLHLLIVMVIVIFLEPHQQVPPAVATHLLQCPHQQAQVPLHRQTTHVVATLCWQLLHDQEVEAVDLLPMIHRETSRGRHHAVDLGAEVFEVVVTLAAHQLGHVVQAQAQHRSLLPSEDRAIRQLRLIHAPCGFGTILLTYRRKSLAGRGHQSFTIRVRF